MQRQQNSSRMNHNHKIDESTAVGASFVPDVSTVTDEPEHDLQAEPESLERRINCYIEWVEEVDLDLHQRVMGAESRLQEIDRQLGTIPMATVLAETDNDDDNQDIEAGRAPDTGADKGNGLKKNRC